MMRLNTNVNDTNPQVDNNFKIQAENYEKITGVSKEKGACNSKGIIGVSNSQVHIGECLKKQRCQIHY